MSAQTRPVCLGRFTSIPPRTVRDRRRAERVRFLASATMDAPERDAADGGIPDAPEGSPPLREETEDATIPPLGERLPRVDLRPFEDDRGHHLQAALPPGKML